MRPTPHIEYEATSDTATLHIQNNTTMGKTIQVTPTITITYNKEDQPTVIQFQDFSTLFKKEAIREIYQWRKIQHEE